MDRQIVTIAHCEAVKHLLHGDRTLPCDDVLIEERHGLTLVGGRLEIEFVARVFLHFAPFGHVDAELLGEEFANFYRIKY